MPDLIVVLDSRNGSSIGTQDYRYGLQVTVIGLACDPRWTTPDGLKLGGPHAFGYVSGAFHRQFSLLTCTQLTHSLDVPYVPIGKYSKPRSVIEEYRQRSSAN